MRPYDLERVANKLEAWSEEYKFPKPSVEVVLIRQAAELIRKQERLISRLDRSSVIGKQELARALALLVKEVSGGKGKKS